MKIKKYFPWSQRGHKFWNDVLNEEEISLNQILPKLLQLSFNPKASKQLVNLITKEYGLDDKAHFYKYHLLFFYYLHYFLSSSLIISNFSYFQ